MCRTIHCKIRWRIAGRGNDMRSALVMEVATEFLAGRIYIRCSVASVRFTDLQLEGFDVIAREWR